MTLLAISSVAQKHRRRRITATPVRKAELTFSMSQTTKKKGRSSRIVFRLSKDLCAKAKILPSERLEVFFDPTSRKGEIRRTNVDGYAMATPGIRATERVAGQHYPSAVTITHYKGMPKIDGQAVCVVNRASATRISFTFPDNTKF